MKKSEKKKKNEPRTRPASQNVPPHRLVVPKRAPPSEESSTPQWTTSAAWNHYSAIPKLSTASRSRPNGRDPASGAPFRVSGKTTD